MAVKAFAGTARAYRLPVVTSNLASRARDARPDSGSGDAFEGPAIILMSPECGLCKALVAA